MKLLTVINRTEEGLLLSHISSRTGTRSGSYYQRTITVPPASLFSLELPTSRPLLALKSESEATKQGLSADKELDIQPDPFAIHISLTSCTKWKAVNIGGQCPWQIFHRRVSRSCSRLLVLPLRNVASFLGDTPDSLALSSLVLPGTHDTMAMYGWPISQCQSLATPLAVQLQSGIRVLDIRLAVIDGHLIAYHGIYPQKATFQSILLAVHDFLTTPATCRETIVMSVKQEDFAKVDWTIFSKLFQEEIFGGPGGKDIWFLENRIPLLGEVRGKVILFSRFGGDGTGWDGGLEGLGIHPSTWPDSAKNGFTWECKDTVVRTHDWYNIPSFLSIPEKATLAREVLLPSDPAPNKTSLSISFLSAASFPLAFPATVARGFGWPRAGFGVEGVNSRTANWLVDQLAGGTETSEMKVGNLRAAPIICGWVLSDFYQDPWDVPLIPLLIECNFQGRAEGEKGLH